jgi:hypothetical protein
MKLLFPIVAFLFLLSNCSAPISSYYVNSQTGNDENPGTIEKPFQSIAKVNQLKLQAGNSVLFAGGQTFKGNLYFKGISGTKESPIKLSSYGNGRAIIDAGNGTGIKADSCVWLQVKNLKVVGTDRLKGNEGSGIELRKTQNCSIDSVETSGFLWSGVKAVGGKNLQITHVYAHDNGFSGINVESDGQDAGGLEGSWGKSFHNVYIAHCVAENNPGCPVVKNNHSGNGILIGGVTKGLIEYCEAMNNGWDMPREGNGPVGIWAYQSDSITIQYCYAHDNKTSPKGKDGGGFDLDGGITNSVVQYNFSANNEGAGYGLFQYCGATVWKNNIVRNNISYNDGRKNGQAGFLMWISNGKPEPISDCQISENTVVNCYGHAVGFEPGEYPNFVFRNNTFILTEKPDSYVSGNYTGATFTENLAWAIGNKSLLPFPEDQLAKLTDPKIRLPKNHNELPGNVQDMLTSEYFKPIK